MTPLEPPDFPALAGVAPADVERLRARFAGWADSYLACTAAPTVARDEILAAVRERGGDVPPAPEKSGSFQWYEGAVLLTELRGTWCIHARDAADLVPWLQAFGHRQPRKPIWLPAFSAVAAVRERAPGDGLSFQDQEPAVEGTFLLRDEGADIHYRQPGGGMSLQLLRRGVVGLHTPWQSSFPGVPALPRFAVPGVERRAPFLDWLHEQSPSPRLVEAVSEALDVAHGILRFDRTAMCGPVLCHARFFAGIAEAQAFESPLLAHGDPWLPPGAASRLLAGYWDIGASDAFVYLGEDRRAHRYTFDDDRWTVTASSYAAYVERILRFDARHAATVELDLPIADLCDRLSLVADPMGTDETGTLAVSADLVAFQRPGERALVKAFTPEAESRARSLLGV